MEGSSTSGGAAAGIGRDKNRAAPPSTAVSDGTLPHMIGAVDDIRRFRDRSVDHG